MPYAKLDAARHVYDPSETPPYALVFCQDTSERELSAAACPADSPRDGLRVEGYTPPDEVVRAVERILAAAGIAIGGVEYLIDERDDRLYFNDVNALSNFVADAPGVIGFDPFEPLADWLEREVDRAQAAIPVVAGVALGC